MRISFIGGGTDFSKYYEKNEGFFVSTTIDRYIYCTIKNHSTSFKENYRLNYSENELVDSTARIKNDIIRSSLSRFSRENYELERLYIGTIGDIRSNSGLGSSSAFACALDLGLAQLTKNPRLNPSTLAQRACQIEIEHLRKKIGIQDQWASSHGGLRKYAISRDGTVSTKKLKITNAQTAAINECLLLVDTGQSRKAEKISEEYSRPNIRQKRLIYKLHEKALEFPDQLVNTAPKEIPGLLANCLSESWNLKKELSSLISNNEIDLLYEKMIRIGCLGGKILGAGGGGYLLMIAPLNKVEKIESILQKMSILYDKPSISNFGTEVLTKC
jgi:D-glycero-alpha-D-manno-heptose-7-phosphate kinase